ncbi:MAG: bifunctional demethylmenaquinone methyltransferase/2-methoxy-6-polyprenyl-1,4-benzoquinol methylase UbiE [Planctomycetota bacterium]|nr:bifunctional demethylmenaquinone methyltransferase/2-methoxy-6-polyprenyl-1,4-benzoquinol methylase UbiE [Planctomycetota bacterium]
MSASSPTPAQTPPPTASAAAGKPAQEPAWTDRELANPHAVADKARRVEAMFAAIAPSYDLNNRLHSMGLDQTWRRRCVRLAELAPGDVVVDVACGTGDLSLAFARGGAARVIGVDFTYPMLRIARGKPAPAGRAQPAYHTGDAMRLPLADASADVVSIAFGIRNVARPEAAVAEFFRVLRPGGRLLILEFSQPTNPVLAAFYRLYTQRIMPLTATLIARDRSGAYRYLPRSVNTFMDRRATLEMLGRAGFGACEAHPLTFGATVVYRGVKR